jgi:hypothetical protein
MRGAVFIVPSSSSLHAAVVHRRHLLSVIVIHRINEAISTCDLPCKEWLAAAGAGAGLILLLLSFLVLALLALALCRCHWCCVVGVVVALLELSWCRWHCRCVVGAGVDVVATVASWVLD